MAAPTVLILAAGQGTRMHSRTPKVLHDLCGIPMVMWPVRAAREAGAERVVVVDSPELPLEGLLPDDVELAVQPTANGTGGAVSAAMASLDGAAAGGPEGTVVVLAGDVPLVSAAAVEGLVAAHAASGAAATMASTVLSDPSGYGRVVRGTDGTVERVVETKRPGDASAAELEIHEVNTGIFAFSAAALRETLPRLTADNAQGELYLPQVLTLLRDAGERVEASIVQDERLVLGINDRVALARVRKLAQASIHECHMLAGVSIVDPDNTVIDVDVTIGQDTVIEPFTTIRGSTRIGSECTIRHSYLVDCMLEDGVSVGPFGYLRPGTVLRRGSKSGTFVEIKNSDIGEGAKVPHLSYIGDATVGERTNLGAATITANYDGRAKHRTSIGADVHTGVDTTFVAPVEVGDGAYTGAGSVITEDVPPGALGMARERQQNIEGYADRHRDP
ncbi:MAG TPA: bifunctional UDP-N-acetylglucosamine diphosphorylase/glucosamine-1-phosphate N-acetyltransferase GlmU [Solirubrobacteraceae bacterium]|nr:bifunctional UDP-N-acetylglucosamine diphosphorylase/glucosamine-1-phosphate N-acetyltransferase GlmU [Solirubrobacteraceae bacterium]